MNDLGEIAGQRFDALWENGPIGAFVADSDGKWLAVNRRWTEITGISAEQALSSDGLLSLVHPEDSVALRAGWEQVISTGEQGETSFRLLHEERGTRHLLATVVGLTGQDGQRTGILGTVSDETDRRVAEAALRSSEELHRLTIKNLPDSAVGLYDLDMRCLIMEGIEARGMTSETLRGKPIEEFCPPEVMESLQPGIDAALAGGEYQGEYTVSALNERWGFHTAPFVDESGLITGVMIVAQNITEQRKAEQETRRVEGMFRVAFDRAPIGMAIVGMDERFDRVNRSLEEMVGTTDERLRSGSVFDIVEPRDAALARAVFARVVESGESGGEMRLVRADDRKLWVDVHATLVTDEDGMPLHILVQVQDVTDRHELIGRLEHMVIHDPLTNLLNRRGLETALAAQIAVNRRYGERGCLMILDLDNFKQVNDAAGHAVGDELIVATADALRTRLRESDVIARLGGDEFAVILPEQDLQEAQQVARDVIAEIGARGQEVGPGLGAVTASIGLTALCSVGMTPGDALIRADHAMYKSKRAGKNRVVPYDETSMNTGMPTGSSKRTEPSSSS